MKEMTVVGIVSDTHGLLRPEAVEALRGAEMIIHAGDIGKNEVIDHLQALAPVTAVRGNCDHGAWAGRYPAVQRVSVEGVTILVLHDRKECKLLAPGESARVVISGHTHKPLIEERDGVLYLNPGSAGRRRFDLPVTVAVLKIDGDQVSAEIFDLDPAQALFL